MAKRLSMFGAVGICLAIAWVRAGEADPGGAGKQGDPNAPAPPKAQPQPKKPGGNLEYWLNQAATAPAESPETQPRESGAPGQDKDPFRRPDALPGVLRTSQGTVLPGWLYTTLDKPWMVWIENEKRWRRIPFVTVLSITAVVVEEKMELKWRWKEMGVPERVYTGESYPSRMLKWRFRLIDGTELVGDVKGQPLWVQLADKKAGPFVLHERLKGTTEQKLNDLVHVQKVFVSRRLMEEVVADRKRRDEKPGK